MKFEPKQFRMWQGDAVYHPARVELVSCEVCIAIPCEEKDRDVEVTVIYPHARAIVGADGPNDEIQVLAGELSLCR